MVTFIYNLQTRLTKVEEAEQAARDLGLPVVVKAQVHVGGRGKAGGVKLAKKMKEVSPVHFILSKYPEGSRQKDAAGQLPLHVAIDHLKRNQHNHNINGSIHKEVDALLEAYPGALQVRDGRTGLHPWAQAAAGSKGDVELAFSLLRRDPVLIR